VEEATARVLDEGIAQFREEEIAKIKASCEELMSAENKPYVEQGELLELGQLLTELSIALLDFSPAGAAPHIMGKLQGHIDVMRTKVLERKKAATEPGWFKRALSYWPWVVGGLVVVVGGVATWKYFSSDEEEDGSEE